jgi:hypothetical protein
VRRDNLALIAATRHRCPARQRITPNGTSGPAVTYAFNDIAPRSRHSSRFHRDHQPAKSVSWVHRIRIYHGLRA